MLYLAWFTRDKFGRLIINNNVDPLFPQKIFSLAAMRETVMIKTTGQQDDAAREYFFNYLTYGAYRVISMWLNKEQRETPNQIAQLLMSLTQLE